MVRNRTHQLGRDFKSNDVCSQKITAAFSQLLRKRKSSRSQTRGGLAHVDEVIVIVECMTRCPINQGRLSGRGSEPVPKNTGIFFSALLPRDLRANLAGGLDAACQGYGD